MKSSVKKTEKERQWEEVDSSEAADFDGRTFQTPSAWISQTELVNSPETAQQGDWSHRVSKPKFKHLARSSSKTKSCILLQSSLHSWAQAAPTHQLGCASSSFPFHHAALNHWSTFRTICTAWHGLINTEQSHHWRWQISFYKHVTNMNIVVSLFSFWSNYHRRFNVEKWHKGMRK